MSTSLAVLEEQYFTLKRNLSSLLDACKDDDQRKDVRTQYSLARGNYWKAQDKILNDNDPKVLSAIAKASAGQKKMEQAIEHLEDMAKTLDIISGAISAGTKLASMLAV